MQQKILLFTVVALLLSATTQAQNHNPYKDIGKKGKVLTLTNGKYDEFFDDDSIQQIGTALVNIKTMQVVKFQLTKEEKRILDNSANSRFLSVDPIASSYPMLTPYQYASNRPIDGIDLDGLEYIRFVVLLDKNGSFLKKYVAEDFRNKSEQEMNQIHKTNNFYTQYSAGFGKLGKGVEYTYFKKTDQGTLEPAGQDWEVMQQTFTGELTRHGLYYGAGSITSRGPLFDKDPQAGTGAYDFGYKSIDLVDASGKAHDMEEDFVGFKGWQHPQNILADIRFVKRLDKYLEAAKDANFIDPFTGRKPSEEAINAANNAKTLFTKEILLKKTQLTLMFTSKEITARTFNYLEHLINKTEKENVSLPTPDKTDK